MEMPIPFGKATLRALDNIIAAKRVLQGDVPSRRCTRSGLPGPTLLPRGTRAGGAVAVRRPHPSSQWHVDRDGRDDRQQATVVVPSGRASARSQQSCRGSAVRSIISSPRAGSRRHCQDAPAPQERCSGAQRCVRCRHIISAAPPHRGAGSERFSWRCQFPSARRPCAHWTI